MLPALTQTDTPEHTTIAVHVPHGSSVVVVVADASGHEEFLTQVEDFSAPQHVGGVLTGRARFALGPLTPGHYVLMASLEDGTEVSGELVVEPAGSAGSMPEEATTEAPATAEPAASAEPAADDGPAADEEIVADEAADESGTDGEGNVDTTDTPGEVGLLADAGRAEYGGRNWGVSTALYATRSSSSWGVGDLADLADLAAIAASFGADYLLMSPISSSSREAVSALGVDPGHREPGGLVIDPLYIRPEDIREVGYLPTSQRTMLEWGAETIRAGNTDPGKIDFTEVWEAKRAALETIYAARRSPVREASLRAFMLERGQHLADYVHGAVAAEDPDSGEAFAVLRADTPAGASARRERADRIEFHLWLQWVASEQLDRAARCARRAGMRIGLVHTVSATAGQEALETLAEYSGGLFLTDLTGSAPLSEVPEQEGILVVADGRGPGSQEHLGSRGVIPLTTLWSEVGGAAEHPFSGLPRNAMLAVTTMADPPTAGFLAEEHLDTLERYDLLDEPLEDARKRERIHRGHLLDQLRGRGLATEHSTERQLVEGLHQYLAHSPARLLTATLSDGVGNRRPLALGGTYPDWRYPLTDGANTAVLIDDLSTNARFISFLEAIDGELRRQLQADAGGAPAGEGS